MRKEETGLERWISFCLYLGRLLHSLNFELNLRIFVSTIVLTASASLKKSLSFI